MKKHTLYENVRYRFLCKWWSVISFFRVTTGGRPIGYYDCSFIDKQK